MHWLPALVTNNVPVFDDRTERVRVFENYEGRRVLIGVKDEPNDRTARQNRYLWLCYSRILDRLKELGHDTVRIEIAGEIEELFLDAEMIHEAKKAKFLKLVNEDTGEIFIGSTTKIVKSKFFEQYVDLVRKDAAEIGCFIPDPKV